MAKLYEKAWNQTVQELSRFKKKIIIENFPYDDPSDKRMSDEVVRDAIRLAESWEANDKAMKEYAKKVTTPAP